MPLCSVESLLSLLSFWPLATELSIADMGCGFNFIFIQPKVLISIHTRFDQNTTEGTLSSRRDGGEVDQGGVAVCAIIPVDTSLPLWTRQPLLTVANLGTRCYFID